MEFPALHKIDEPKLMFEAFTANPYHIHPLKGLIEFGPYSHKLAPIEKIRIGVICPANCFHIVQGLVSELNRSHTPLERVNYLPTFEGFIQTFKTQIELLPENHSVQIDGNKILNSGNKPYIALSQELGNAIRTMNQRKQDFDVLFLLLPEQWKDAFADQETSFDLHDFIKATTAIHSIPTQILREGSVINYRCRCSVMWRLGIALYVKAGGVPWKLGFLDEDTAFVGLSYSSRYNPQTNSFDFTTCCSQVFDSDGTGLEFIAYDTGEVEFHVGENPFLTRAEMRKVMSKSLNLYQKRHSGRPPKRLIVHKTSHFSKNEIDGAFDAVPSNINLELLQIVENSNWRGVKYNKTNGVTAADGYPLDRGSYVQTGAQEVMLWTQGNVVLSNKNFFKEGKNIPAPLIIKRFAGEGAWNQNCLAIMGLTKMNWNHDALYDRLPVTLGYAKVLATTIKRMNTLVNKPYEFRYFM
ncbi:MAG: argonaute/piwi family protein [Bacteroidia bacterium]